MLRKKKINVGVITKTWRKKNKIKQKKGRKKENLEKRKVEKGKAGDGT